MTNKSLSKWLLAPVFGLGLLASPAMACQLNDWDSTSTAQPKSAAQGGIRLAGLCALDATSGKAVKTGLNGSGNTYIRFYAYNDGANGQIFKTGALTASVSGNNLTIGDQTQTVSLPLSQKKWHKIQLQIQPTGTTLWIDKKVAEPATKTGLTGIAKVTDLELGGGVAGGKLFIDSVVISNDDVIDDKAIELTKAKTIIPGDANGDGGLDSEDVYFVKQEIFSILLGDFTGKEQYLKGVPDINLDGVIDSQDVYEIKAHIFNKLLGL